MKMVQKLAGYTLGRADIVRKAMGKENRHNGEGRKSVYLR